MEEDSFWEGYRSTLDWFKSQIVLGPSTGMPSAPLGDPALRRAWQRGADKADEDLGFVLPADDEGMPLDPESIGRMVGERLARMGRPISDAAELNPYVGYFPNNLGSEFLKGVANGMNKRDSGPVST